MTAITEIFKDVVLKDRIGSNKNKVISAVEANNGAEK